MSFHGIISQNARMHELFDLVRKAASLRSTVLIQGESGTGKEMIARALHFSGNRGSRPFVAVSCAALAETLLESELFGHEKGSFTGAGERKKGKFELAEGGTIFLDEIGDIPLKLQLDLLRVLQERKFYRVGGSEEIRVDVRVVAATKVDLRTAVARGTFRDDLYYRLNVIEIECPCLRERREDIPGLVDHFVRTLCAELDKDVAGVDEDALELLMEQDWLGNVRELHNAVERAMVTCRRHMLTRDDFLFLNRRGPEPSEWNAPTHLPLAQVERHVIEAVLRRTGGNIKASARVLGIDRSTLYKRIEKYGISR